MRAVMTFGFLMAVSFVGRPAFAQPMLRVPDNREGWPFGLCVHKAAQEEGPATAALDELAAPWIRIDANWNEIEPAQGEFHWDEMDRMVDTARAHGLLVFATLAYTPQWATDGAVRSGVPRTPDVFASFAGAVASRYGDRVKHWGMWNEPEQPRFWAGTAQDYLTYVLAPGATAVHGADPQAVVLGPDSGSDAWLDELFAAGGGQHLDVITVHVYACCDDTDDVAKALWRLDGTGGLPWDSSRRAVILKYGLGDKPVWLTEVGWKTLTTDWEQKQATYYPELLAAMLTRPWWNKTLFYEFHDEMCDPANDTCWGITRPDWTHKPAFDAFKAFIPAHQPRAQAGADILVAPGQSAVFDGSGSVDPDGSIVQYRWDFDRADGVNNEAEGAIVSKSWSAVGTFVVTLVVTDGHGYEDADTLTVTVSGEPVADGGVGGGGTGGQGQAGASGADASLAAGAGGASMDAASGTGNGGSAAAGLDAGGRSGAAGSSTAGGSAAESTDPGCGCRGSGSTASGWCPLSLLSIAYLLRGRLARRKGSSSIRRRCVGDQIGAVV